EVLHVGDVRFWKQWQWGCRSVVNRRPISQLGERNQPALQVSTVRLRDVLVLADDDRTAGPEVLCFISIMRGQTNQHVVPFAKVHRVAERVLRVWTDQAIDSSSFHLLAHSQFGKLRS